MKDKIIEILQSKLNRRVEQEKLHGVGRVSHTLQVPLHIDEAKWLIKELSKPYELPTEEEIGEIIEEWDVDYWAYNMDETAAKAYKKLATSIVSKLKGER
jgi:hypothetical protein